MSWIYLMAAGVFEWGWPMGLKLGWIDGAVRWPWIVFAALCMALSGWLLLLSLAGVPMGTAYAVWTGIGAAGTFVLGILVFHEPAEFARMFFVALIVAGIAGLKLTSP